MAPKSQSSKAYNSGMPEKLQSASSKWKGGCFQLNKKKGICSYNEVAKIYGKNKSSICEIVKKEKEIWASFAIVPQAVRVIAMAHKCLVRLEKPLNLWVDINRICVQTDRNALGQKTLSIYKNFSKGSPEMSDTSHLLQVRDGYIDLGLDWKIHKLLERLCLPTKGPLSRFRQS